MWTAGFPEPRTFSRRVLRVLRERAGDFDVVHDNQTLGTALLEVEAATGLPLVASIHHPITHRPPDRPRAGADLAEAALGAPLVRLRPDAGPRGPGHADGADARRSPPSGTSSASSASIPDRVRVVLLGVDDGFVPPTDAPGARAGSWRWRARTHRSRASPPCWRRSRSSAPSAPSSSCCWSPSRSPGGRTEQLLDELAIRDHVRFVHGVSDAELVDADGLGRGRLRARASTRASRCRPPS